MGGGRSGGVSRKTGETKVYRRVQSTTENANTTNESDSSVSAATATHGTGAANGGRKVVMLDEPSDSDLKAGAFKSSLQASIRLQSSEPSKYEKVSKKNGAASSRQQQQHDRPTGKRALKGEKPKSPPSVNGARERSSSPQKRGDRQTQSAAQSGRVVTAVSTTSSVGGTSPKKLADRKKGDAKQPISRLSVSKDAPKEDDKDQPQTFVSSLTSSLASKETGQLSDHKQAPHADRPAHRGGGASHTRPQHQQAGNSRDARYQTRDVHTLYRKVEDSTETSYGHLSEKNLQRKASFSRPLSRKNSSESLSSMRSGRSERSERSDYGGGGSRWDRKPKYGGDYRQDDYRHSMGNDKGARYAQNGPSHHHSDDNVAPVGRSARSMSDSSRSHNGGPSPPPAPVHVVATARSSQDVRFQKSSSNVSAHSGGEFRGRPQRTGPELSAAAPAFQSSLNASLARSSAQDFRSSDFSARSRSSSLARSVVSDMDSTPRISLHKNPDMTSGTKTLTSPRGSLTSSSLRAASGGDAKENVSTPKPAVVESPIDEAEKKRLASETLEKRFEARRAERGALSKSFVCEELAAPEAKKEFRSGLTSTAAASTGSDVLSMSKEKEQRVNEHYNNLKQESAMNEAARRANGFKSSLLSSISATLTTPASQGRAQKTCYVIAELRRLMPSSTPKPNDLPDMTLIEVTEFRPQTRAPGGGGSLRPGRAVSREHEGRATGRFAKRPERPERAQRGSAVQRQSSFAGGSTRRDAGKHRGGGRGGGGGRGYGPPPPPLYDGPIEPLTVSENRWVPKKEALSVMESTLSYVKGLLNKLTREKFAKLTSELCAVEMKSFELLRSVVSVIMDKALEEANFADVYADLCKEMHSRTVNKHWSFIRAIESTTTQGVFYWTAVREDDYQSMVGPLKSLSECFEDASLETTTLTPITEHVSLSAMKFVHHGEFIVAVAEVSPGGFFYHKRKISELSEDEPLIGTFPSADPAIAAAHQQANFKSLLVTRCQFEFEKTNKHTTVGKAQQQDTNKDVGPRQKEILAIRAKRHMLGNIRFIGELFKVDMLNKNVVQGCIFHLLGLEMIKSDGEKQEFAAQTIRFPDEEDLEALCKMLATVGKKFEQPKTKTIMNIIILRLVELSEDTKLPSRARFLIKDLLEMRDHMWEPRRAEMQQKTLDEVRREAQKLQQQGKNAQHDNLSHRRKKTQVSSVQLAKQSSSLLLHKEEEEEEIVVEEEPTAALAPASPTKEVTESAGHEQDEVANFASRIKNIIQEYTSIVDIEEATVCVRELPLGACHVEFAEQTINLSLEGKTSEREHAVNLLVGLYERGALTAPVVQAAILTVAEFLEDMRIDIPLVHQYSALLFGRLISAGCFGISWMILHPLAHLVECELTSLVFAEVLAVLEAESDLRSVKRMLVDEEVALASVLPASKKCNEAEIQQFLLKNGIEDFFADGNDDEDCDDDEQDELDPEVAGKMRSTLEEYLSVKDLNELVMCIDELEGDTTHRWMHFVQIAVEYSIDTKKSVRDEVSALLLLLAEGEHLTSDDLEVAMESILVDYEDLRIDIPKISVNLSDLWTDLFHKQFLPLNWLRDATSHLVASGFASEIVDTLFAAFEARFGQQELREWWTKQEKDGFWNALEGAAGGEGGQVVVKSETLSKWKQVLE